MRDERYRFEAKDGRWVGEVAGSRVWLPDVWGEAWLAVEAPEGGGQFVRVGSIDLAGFLRGSWDVPAAERLPSRPLEDGERTTLAAVLQELADREERRKARIAEDEARREAERKAKEVDRLAELAKRGAFAAYGDTYPVRERLAELGGRWDREAKTWYFDAAPIEAVPGVAFAPNPLPKGWWVYEDCRAEVGSTFVRPLALRDRATRQYPRSEYAVAVAAWTGSTFDDDSERWRKCDCLLARPLTDAEWAGVEARRTAEAARKAALESFERAIHEAGDTPKGVSPPADRVEWKRRSRPDLLARDERSIYLAHYNGASGDDWSHNNWADSILWVAPRTPELDRLYETAVATLRGA